MDNFIFKVPTAIYFGKGQLDRLGMVTAEYGKKALLVYGGGSIKRNGIYERVIQLLQEEGVSYLELPGVDPNPRIDTVRKGVRICKFGVGVKRTCIASCKLVHTESVLTFSGNVIRLK